MRPKICSGPRDHERLFIARQMFVRRPPLAVPQVAHALPESPWTDAYHSSLTLIQLVQMPGNDVELSAPKVTPFDARIASRHV
ncbi:hypothetical protein C8Q77DRAFT_931950 [Trametes polyzona]|nr:hypothetical protein C8Q77DRAFT_931950 [Trametes polyzona]